MNVNRTQLGRNETLKRAMLKHRSNEMSRFIATYLEGRNLESSEPEISDRGNQGSLDLEEIEKLEMANRAAANSKLVGFFTLIP